MALKQFLLYISLFCIQSVDGKQTTYFTDSIRIEFLGKPFTLPSAGPIEEYTGNIIPSEIFNYANQINSTELAYVCQALLDIQKKESLDDWLYYQLIRKVSQQCINKKSDYIGYTLFKWYFLRQTGYEPLLSVSENKLLLYIRSEDDIYNLPLKKIEHKQYVCLNYHDYGFKVDFNHEKFTNINSLMKAGNSFSFLIKKLNDFGELNYHTKEIKFLYKNRLEQLTIRLNPDIGSYFKNYPVTDYKNQFNIPLSKETYESLIPALKAKLIDLDITRGVEYLMYFTRNAFLFERDTEIFGMEKRLSPEETLLYEKSDCEDRSALFFLLVKEIYNLPMIVLSSPEHVTVAVKLDKPIKQYILHQGEAYTICETTPQKRELKIGEQVANINKQQFVVEFAYCPE